MSQSNTVETSAWKKAVRISSIGSEVQKEINQLAIFYFNFIEPNRYLIHLSRTLLQIYSQYGGYKQCSGNFSLKLCTCSLWKVFELDIMWEKNTTCTTFSPRNGNN